MFRKKNGFTIVEMLVVITIIGLLAGMVIPNLLRAKTAANDAKAKATLRALSTATESFATFNAGNYPGDITSLTIANPAYINNPYCEQNVSGFTYHCTFSTAGYTLSAEPVVLGTSGTTTYTVSTGGVLTPAS
jgi:type IV pilus assembly protein PilA